VPASSGLRDALHPSTSKLPARARQVAYRKGNKQNSIHAHSKVTLKDHCDMAKSKHLTILKSGINKWNRWREEQPDVTPDLSKIDLRNFDFCEANLEGVDFRKTILGGSCFIGADISNALLSESFLDTAWFNSAKLIETDLTMAHLERAIFPDSDLSGAHLNQSILHNVDFSGANLFDVDLSEADLFGAIFCESYLFLTDFSRARLAFTVFADVDLSLAANLERAIHNGPSTLGIDAIYRSNGKIPEKFLRDAGVPESAIHFILSLQNSPSEYYSCFISHSTKDKKFIECLYKDLRKAGIRCWLSTNELRTGDRIRDNLDKAIRAYDKLIVVLSKNSVESDWVEKEVETAFEEERKKKKTLLFPIRLDDEVMETNKAWAADIRRSRQIGDFTKWNNQQSYNTLLSKLIRDLKKTKSTK
jgi:uncharacterized protein YjbI with pentapeptide repeats